MNAGKNAMRHILLVFAAGFASSCMTILPDRTLVKTNPAGAVVTVEGFGECETPCRIKVDEPRTATVAKAGYEKKQIMLEPGRSTVSIDLKLAAPTEEVEKSDLPKL